MKVVIAWIYLHLVVENINANIYPQRQPMNRRGLIPRKVNKSAQRRDHNQNQNRDYEEDEDYKDMDYNDDDNEHHKAFDQKQLRPHQDEFQNNPNYSRKENPIKRQSSSLLNQKAQIQWMITNQMRNELLVLGYQHNEIVDMDPRIAKVVIEKNLHRPKKGMPPNWRRNQIISKASLFAQQIGVFRGVAIFSFTIGMIMITNRKEKEVPPDLLNKKKGFPYFVVHSISQMAQKTAYKSLPSVCRTFISNKRQEDEDNVDESFMHWRS